ncbi:MAG: hypothetical protein IT271_12015 [Chitinophagales bacterium]|nr:hypothetical protein [Chitinophagales bacterium]
MSEVQKAKIVSCFNITGRGIIAEIQHNLNGLPPDTILKDFNSDNFWVLKERVFQGLLQIHDKEIYFDCETKFSHISNRFTNKTEEIEFLNKEVEKRNNGIYWYFLTPNIKDNKPTVGQELLVELNQL